MSRQQHEGRLSSHRSTTQGERRTTLPAKQEKWRQRKQAAATISQQRMADGAVVKAQQQKGRSCDSSGRRFHVSH
jgi:hypothetical protein